MNINDLKHTIECTEDEWELVKMKLREIRSQQTKEQDGAPVGSLETDPFNIRL